MERMQRTDELIIASMDPVSYYKSPTKRVVLGHLNQNGNSPVSPMANLKLLTKVATSHFPMEENSQIMSLKEEVEEIKAKCCRRLRSLSFICKKFLVMYRLDIPSGQCDVISLGNLATSLGIEKRRVYDIINVVASLKMAVRLRKDKYKWYGNQNLSKHLSELKTYAIQNKLNQQVEQLVKYQNHMSDLDDHAYNNFDPPKISFGPKKSDDNRIGILCQKFMMMFLVVNEVALSLTGISKLILSSEQGKTGMRRLYDVANVLETLGLIKRHGRMHKKPTFVYCGPKIETTEEDLTNESVGSVIQNIDYCDTSSESSSDVPTFRKIDSMLEVVCTELEKFDDEPRAKRKLCLDSSLLHEIPALKEPPSFIKAPNQSFRFICNKITQKPIDDFVNCIKDGKSNNNEHPNEILGPPKTFTISEIKGSSLISADRKGSSEGHMSIKIQQPIKIFKPVKRLYPVIQNGAIYRAVKNGNVIKLVKL